jgi:hypothetical protein
MLIIFSLFESVIKRYENANGEHTIFVHIIRPIAPTSYNTTVQFTRLPLSNVIIKYLKILNA